MKRLIVPMLCASLFSAACFADTQNTQTAGASYMQAQLPSAKNQLAGDTFLAENKKKPGVVTLPDGLQYKIITAGNGVHPTANDIVTVHYAGRLIDGTEFDSSY